MTNQTPAPKPLVEFNEEDHTYWKDGRRVPSVTECLKSVGLIPGLEFVSDEAVMFGVRVHRMIHFYNKKTLDLETVTPDLMPALDAYREFEAATGFEPMAWETRVMDAQLWVAGTYDVSGTFPKGERVGFVDLKSGIVKPWTAIQLAGYARCAGNPYARRFGLSVRNGKPRMEEFKNVNDQGLFVGAVSIHNWKLNQGVKGR